MLKKISVSQVRRGMYVHAVEGSWLNHSLWKTRFLIEDDAGLVKLRDSGVAELWIDLARGSDLDNDPDAEGPAASATAMVATLTGPVSMADELARAQQIRDRAKVVVTAMFQEARLGKTIDPQGCAPLVSEVVESVYRNGEALVSLCRLKVADEYTYLHSVAVCALLVALGKELGFSQAQCHDAGMAGLMHDLGKAAVPLDIIRKPGKLTESEFDIIRQHPARGHAMLMRAGVTNEAVLGVCRHHHERMDGKGYPDRLPGNRIPQLIRMAAVCDVYDAITSNRPYKAGWDPAESIARMSSWNGHFDEEVLRAFIKSLGIYPVGSLVRLTSGRLAVVIGQNPQKLTAPRVKVFFSAGSGTAVKPEELDLHDPACSEQIVGRESPGKWSFANLDRLWLENA